MEGWIKIHRQLQNNKFWTCEPFTRGQAWVDLILLANHKNGFFYKRGNKVDVQRGQVGVSEVGLSDRWKWSRTKVRKFLNDLEKEQQIIQHKSTITQIVTIVNYDKYQEKEQQVIQQKDSRKTAERQQKDTNKNDKEKERMIKIESVRKIYDSYLEDLDGTDNKDTYKLLVDFLFGNNLQKEPLYNILICDYQLKPSQFDELLKLASDNNKTLRDTIFKMNYHDSFVYPKKTKRFTPSLINWLKNEIR